MVSNSEKAKGSQKLHKLTPSQASAWKCCWRCRD